MIKIQNMSKSLNDPENDGEHLILGIESSCDETACALVSEEGRVRVSHVASQVDLHARFGGVVPEVAARMHIQACLPLACETMNEARIGWERIEAIAVTQGPGLIGCLLVGIETAKTLAWLHRKPLVAVNHLAGHLYGLNLTPMQGTHLMIAKGKVEEVLPMECENGGAESIHIERPAYPHVGLIVSGGHTSLVWIEGPDRFEPLAATRDDAAGEAYDKVARAAGLGYPGGPIIDRLAQEGDPRTFGFTPPMMRRDRPDFSFSGLKTAAGREAERLRAEHGDTIPEAVLKDFCASFQWAAVESLLSKAMAATRKKNARDLIVTGGVASNQGLRRRAMEMTREDGRIRVWFPNSSLCTDNAAMIAGLAWRLQSLPHPEALRLNADTSLGLG